MAVQYQAPTDDMAFVIRHIVDSDAIRQLPGFEEFTDDVIEAVLEEGNPAVLTPDIGGQGNTRSLGKAIAERL